MRAVVCLTAWAWPALVAAQVDLATVSVQGPTGDPTAVEEAFRAVLGAPRDDDQLADAVRAAEALDGVGAISLEVSGAQVNVRFDGQVRRVSAVSFAFGDAPPLPSAENWQLRQQIRARTRLYLSPGSRYHPFLLSLEMRAIRDDLRDQGYRDATVSVEEQREGDLVALLYRCERGPRYEVDQVRLTGAGLGGDLEKRLRAGLLTKAQGYAAPSDLTRDVRHLRRASCRAGYPRAQVSAVERVKPGDPKAPRVEVSFDVLLGPRAEVGAIQVVGYPVPWAFLQTLPLREGAPYCDLLVGETTDALRTFLQERGFYDPRVVVHQRSRVLSIDRRRVSLTLQILSREQAHIARIWFTGNTVTREDIIRQRLAIEEGQVYRQSAVDESVQALRRTGLFRRVRLRVVDSSEPGQVYLYFDLDEQTPIVIDVVERRVRLRNMDVLNWPSDRKHLEQGAFRGAGQELALTGAVEHQGFRWRNPFLSRNWLTELSMDRRTAAETGFEASWYTLRGGIGVQGGGGRFSLLPYAEIEWTNNKQDADASLPLLDGDALTLAGGLDLAADLNRLDDERIPYLGLDLRYVPRAGRSVAGEIFGWFDHDATARIHLPLYTNKRDQHVVLRLRGRFRHVLATESGKLQPHRRTTPLLRGYPSATVGLDFTLADGDTVKLGGLSSLETTAEIRIPLPLRRNAIIPFVDVASTGDTAAAVLGDRFIAPGLAISFSFFNEKLEGILWGAYGIQEAERTYAGGSFGGAF